MSGAWVRRARLQATEGAPMPTKQTSSFFSTRAAATAIISPVVYSIAASSSVTGRKHVLFYPLKERFALARNAIPGRIKGVVAPVVAMRIRWMCPARRFNDCRNRPLWKHSRVWTGNAQVIDDFLYGDNHLFGGESSFLLNADEPFNQHISGAICSLRVNDGQVRAQ